MNGSIGSSSSVTVASGAILGGSGTTPAVTVASGATVAPGDAGPGILFSGNASFVAGSTYSTELNGTTVGTQYDQLDVTGTVDLSNATLNASLGYTPSVGDTFTIVNNDGVDAVTGTFSGLAEGAVFNVSGFTFRISYVGGTGNDVVITAVQTSTVTMTSSDSDSVHGQSVTFSVSVSGAGTPTGNASLVIDGTSVQTVALSGGSATFTAISSLTVGPHTVAVNYAGDGNNTTSNGTLGGGQVVSQASTTVSVVSSGGTSVFGQGVTFSATVAPVAPGAGTPTGNASLIIDGMSVQTVALSGGSATFTAISSLAVGSHTVAVNYAGDGNNTTGNGTFTGGQVVTPTPLPPPVVPPSPIFVAFVGSQVGEMDPVTGQVIRTFSPFVGFGGKIVTATADLNGDGVLDLVVGAGAGGGPHVKVFDGVSGVEIASFYAFAPTFRGGVNLATGDVNGDGRVDLIVVAGPGGGSHVKVFDFVNDLEEIASFYAYAPGFAGGVSVAAGDLDGDGDAEIITGAGAGSGPHVKAFDFATGQELLSFYSYAPDFNGGVSVAAGDLDGDGDAEIVTVAGAGGGSHVNAFDGRTLDLIHSFIAYPPEFAGEVNVAVRDVNRDGFADIVIGARAGSSPHVKAFDGRSPELLESFFAEDPAFLGGVSVG